MQVGNENQAFLSKWIDSHAGGCKAIGKPFVLEEFGKNVTAKAKTPKEWKARRTPMFSHAYSEYISSLESGGNYQGALLSLTDHPPLANALILLKPCPLKRHFGWASNPCNEHPEVQREAGTAVCLCSIQDHVGYSYY